MTAIIPERLQVPSQPYMTASSIHPVSQAGDVRKDGKECSTKCQWPPPFVTIAILRAIAVRDSSKYFANHVEILVNAKVSGDRETDKNIDAAKIETLIERKGIMSK
ncbi:hypothetical protein LTR91_012040 [Friedmanniomyces endolithicus]|uniref:Uncharacterized protein n=1 Tax=Friedmanniomyces endolithicus TaxID=329885 RepID=A0AAN6KG82_9PEZI|nr:hypothetical protein LTR94_006624 [Friedmanniomyces endolithicus]KAK0795121.1 hypothetical protein LTR59_007515 [Friedmanniomyces endolithicus]KAK0801999.1 hypothetical protein LTR38_006573 [Friedmanniomyces endolithicus]KAK0820726.1 hypothetical protein LTR75_001311 [Friedmanniomyces endolithicus]KAK0846569.1 hypothetical protein LTR03_006846 [Friedmanniomyces endolithicus]